MSSLCVLLPPTPLLFFCFLPHFLSVVKGRLVKTWAPPNVPASWEPGRAVYNVAVCNQNDASQRGWSYDPATFLLSKQLPTCPNGQDHTSIKNANTSSGGATASIDRRSVCLDFKAADNRQMWVVNCTGTQQQRWSWGRCQLCLPLPTSPPLPLSPSPCSLSSTSFKLFGSCF